MLLTIPISPNRIYGLDVLRAGAIISVMLSHTMGYLPARVQDNTQWLLVDGVGIFFVLSGFLIGGILIKTLEKKPATPPVLLEFWSKRWLRTLPPYLLALVLSFLCGWLANDPNATWRNFAKYSLFVQNLFRPHPDFFNEAWSLAVEEWFYLLVPSTIFLLIRVGRLTPRYAVLTSALLVIVAVTFYRYYKFQHIPPATLQEWDVQLRKIVLTRLDSLMYGVLGAYCAFYHLDFWEKCSTSWALVPGFILIVLLRPVATMDIHSLYVCVFSFSITSLGTLLVLPFASLPGAPRTGLLYRTITHISLISYSLYLLHSNLIGRYVVEVLRARIGFSLLTGFVAVWGLSLLLATLMYKYFEVPTMHLRSKLKVGEPVKVTA